MDELVCTPVYDKVCRVCRWSKKRVPLYNFTMDLFLHGESYENARRVLVEHMMTEYPDIKPPSKKTLWNHVKLHLDVATKEKIKLARDVRYPGLNTPTTLLSPSIIRIPTLGDDKTDLMELQELLDKTKFTIELFFKEMKDLQNVGKDGQLTISPQKYQLWLQSTNTVKNIAVEMSKIRSSDNMVRAATKFILEAFTSEMLLKLTTEFAGVRKMLENAHVSSTVLEQYDFVTRKRLAEVIMGEAKNAMKKTSEEFKFMSLPQGSSHG